MAFIGNTYTTQGFVPAIDYFSGNASTTAFTLSRPVASVAQVQVTIENVPQNPNTAFTVSSNTITFTSAPPSGTNNIYVYYTSPITQVVALPQSPQVFGNLQFSSAGARITGDFSNATIANRVLFQSSTTNGNTVVGLIPNGTGTVCAFGMDTDPTLTNSSTGSLNLVASTDVRLSSGIRGSGTYLPMTFYTGGSERMRVDTSGNVGIGTSSPVAKLNVKTTDGTNTAMIAGTTIGARYTTDASGIYIDGTDPTGGVSYQPLYTGGSIFGVRISGTERMRIDSSGNVGIGTTSPNARLQIDSSSAVYSANIRARNSNFGNGVVGAASNILTIATDMNNMAFYTASNLGVDGTSAPTNERMRIDSSGNLLFNSGYGSVATAYACRAWVNFNGTGTVSIRGSGNVSSITDNGTGDYTVNFTNAMPDANYCVSMSGGTTAGNGRICQPVRTAPTTSGQRVLFQDGSFGGYDSDYCFVAVFR